MGGQTSRSQDDDMSGEKGFASPFWKSYRREFATKDQGTTSGRAHQPTDSGRAHQPTESGRAHQPTESGRAHQPTESGRAHQPTESGRAHQPTESGRAHQPTESGRVEGQAVGAFLHSQEPRPSEEAKDPGASSTEGDKQKSWLFNWAEETGKQRGALWQAVNQCTSNVIGALQRVHVSREPGEQTVSEESGTGSTVSKPDSEKSATSGVAKLQPLESRRDEQATTSTQGDEPIPFMTWRETAKKRFQSLDILRKFKSEESTLSEESGADTKITEAEPSSVKHGHDDRPPSTLRQAAKHPTRRASRPSVPSSEPEEEQLPYDAPIAKAKPSLASGYTPMPKSSAGSKVELQSDIIESAESHGKKSSSEYSTGIASSDILSEPRESTSSSVPVRRERSRVPPWVKGHPEFSDIVDEPETQSASDIIGAHYSTPFLSRGSEEMTVFQASGTSAAVSKSDKEKTATSGAAKLRPLESRKDEQLTTSTEADEPIPVLTWRETAKKRFKSLDVLKKFKSEESALSEESDLTSPTGADAGIAESEPSSVRPRQDDGQQPSTSKQAARLPTRRVAQPGFPSSESEQKHLPYDAPIAKAKPSLAHGYKPMPKSSAGSKVELQSDVIESAESRGKKSSSDYSTGIASPDVLSEPRQSTLASVPVGTKRRIPPWAQGHPEMRDVFDDSSPEENREDTSEKESTTYSCPDCGTPADVCHRCGAKLFFRGGFHQGSARHSSTESDDQRQIFSPVTPPLVPETIHRTTPEDPSSAMSSTPEFQRSPGDGSSSDYV